MFIEAALPHFEILLNRKLKDSITAREFCKTLSGKVLEINNEAIPDTILIAPIGETIELLSDKDIKPDVVFSGSVMSFMQATQSKPMELVRAGKLKMKGDAVLAGQFQRLIELAMPDWQEEIAKMFGDYAGPQISNIVEGLFGFGQQILKGFGNKADEHFQEEGNATPSRSEFDGFSSDVKTMQKDLDDLEKNSDS